MPNVSARIAAKEFATYWKNKGSERSDTQTFWRDLLATVYGIGNLREFISFEFPVPPGSADAIIPYTRVIIEQKSLGIDLSKPEIQSDGTPLTPFEQARRYSERLPYSSRARWIVTCNFAEFWIYDMEKPGSEPEKIKLEKLETEYHRLRFLVDPYNERIKQEMDVSFGAGEIVGQLYKSLKKQYADPKNRETLHSLNVLCVRLVFCLYAEDAGVFEKDQFYEYLNAFEPWQIREELLHLFSVLATPEEKRNRHLNQKLAAFPYVNGGLFSDENIEIPQFTEDMYDLLLEKASADFNWSNISPTIFGAVFESTLNPETQSKGGMHYTSIENIHKVIDPLFLDDLKQEFIYISQIQTHTKRQKTEKTKKLKAFKEKLASFTFLDPACGSGNFLTETYISLRRLENDVLRLIHNGHIQSVLYREFTSIKVNINQFYGIETNDFAVSVAQTALWIAESQMLKETEEIIEESLDFLPLKTNANIVKANALRVNWADIVSKDKLSYIIGNPPFIGARKMQQSQKEDLYSIASEWKNIGNLDYVGGWYIKAARMMEGTSIRTALVSTNSISQGECPAILWTPLMKMGVHIDFAYHTFRWDSEANLTAHVNCVIVGFSIAPSKKIKAIYINGLPNSSQNINGYLRNGDNIHVESRTSPLCKVPEISTGNQPIDDGNYLFTKEEMLEFIKMEPASKKFFRPWYGSDELINGRPRYCLWLGDCPPHELHTMPECLKRVDAVQKFRAKSPRKSTVKLAKSPRRFQVENFPSSEYIAIPETSSQSRRYTPMDVFSPDKMCSNAVRLITDATPYHFGVLISVVHMAWMRVVAGRLKSDYRYSKDIVYNNFPWPKPTKEQKKAIEKTAQGILDARHTAILQALRHNENCTLADLYDDRSMPDNLRRAHWKNDITVMRAYGFDGKNIRHESDIVAELMKMYQKLANKSK